LGRTLSLTLSHSQRAPELQPAENVPNGIFIKASTHLEKSGPNFDFSILHLNFLLLLTGLEKILFFSFEKKNASATIRYEIFFSVGCSCC
jgi:hypothetical protein